MGSLFASMMVNVLFHALTAMPHIVDDVSAILKTHWDHDMVKDFRQGVALAAKLIDDAAPMIPVPAAAPLVSALDAVAATVAASSEMPLLPASVDPAPVK